MKRCPTCNRTFEDPQIFCSEDGTRLVEDSPPAFDPMATMMASPPPPMPQSDRPQDAPFNFGAPPSYQPLAPAQPAFTPQPVYGAQGDAGGGSKFVPVLVGGLVMGFLTSIPVVGGGCCLWAMAGGAVAGLMYIKRAGSPVQMGEGAMLGGIAGVVGGIIHTIIGLPLAYLVYGSNMHSNIGSAQYGAAGYLLMSGIGAFIALVVFGALGGIISVSLFEKRKQGAGFQPPQPPPPQQNFGGYR